MFIFFFERGGALDTILCALGCDQESLPRWLGQANIVNISLTFVSVWRYMGQNMVLFSGATQFIGTEFFEAAELDGANKWQQFRYLIFPGIKSVVMLNLILAVKGSLHVYEVPKIITNGLFGSTTFVMKILDTAFTKNQYRCENFLLTPEEDYEERGFVPNVCFPCATLQDAQTGRIAIYYGAADSYVALAFAYVDELVDYIKSNNTVK